MKQICLNFRSRLRSSVALAIAIVLSASAARAQTAAEVAAANNPLAPITAFNLQNYYIPNIYGDPNSTANAMLLRPVLATTKMILRATLPLATVSGGSTDESGLGDLNIFDAFLLPRRGRTQFGVGPLLVLPTASNQTLGAGKWQAGAAVVAVTEPAPNTLLGGLITYQHSFANSGSVQRNTTNALAIQPLLIIQVGGGWYLRSTPLWNFDLETGHYDVPFGLGAGKVLRVDRAVLNIFLEPQFTASTKVPASRPFSCSRA